jgi:hypothetical protein
VQQFPIKTCEARISSRGIEPLRSHQAGTKKVCAKESFEWEPQAQAWRTSLGRNTLSRKEASRRRSRRLGLVGQISEIPPAIRSRKSHAGFKHGRTGRRVIGTRLIGISEFPWSWSSYMMKSRLAISREDQRR